MLDGAARLTDLFSKARELEMPALALTDHGYMYGAYDFYKQGVASGVKPIIGVEGYYAPQGRKVRAPVEFGSEGNSRDDTDAPVGKGKSAYTHITLWAETTEGMHNLFRLVSLASIEGYYHKPRMDHELLATYSKGIIASTGCPSSEVNRWLQAENYKRALATAAELKEIFGAGNLFAEVMDHGLGIERNHRTDFLKIANDLDLPLVATNDVHYTHAQDAQVHEALLCVGTRSLMTDPNRFKFDSQDFYLKTAAEMRELWADFPSACDNTLLIAERCNAKFTEGANLMPRFAVPTGETEESWLVKEVEVGLQRRFPQGVPTQHRERAAFEVGVVTQMGFPSYFLVIADLVNHARSIGIRVGPGRGSAAASVISYALGITELDPIAHGLLFERFLNPERVSLPDIDIDFDERRRGEVIKYVTEKYGDDHVAQIVTYGTIKAKAAVKDAARVLGYPYALSDRITKVMPPAIMGKDVSLAGMFDKKDPRYGEAATFRDLYDNDHDAKSVIDTARGFEGLKRQPGVHAAGVIMCREPLTDVIPVWRREQDGAVITQFDMVACESLGLLKMDFLGLRNLSVLDDALENIQANRGEKVVLEALTLDDSVTYELLSRGETLGVFQLDGAPMRALLRSMKPDRFEHISAVLALYRPGPMGANAHNDYADRKNGRKPVVALHPELADPLADILSDTYGLIVYQEQVMAIAQRVAGYSLAKADLLRRAMGKKKKSILDKEFIPFREGMLANGYSDGAAKVLWELLVPFSDYAFNKAHTAGYGLVSYWTAYLKANYTSEYMAALLTSVRDDKDKMALYLNECRRMGVKVLPPDVNESSHDFTPVGTDIRCGLAAIRNVGDNVVDLVVKARETKGRFGDFYDFLDKVDQGACNKRTIESLIKAGAFDSLGHTRKGLVHVHAEAIDAIMETKRAQAIGQFDLFADGDVAADAGLVASTQPLIGMSEWEKPVLLAFEREMLGLYVSDHPLLGIEHVLNQRSDVSIAGLHSGERNDGDIVSVAGLVSSVQRKVTKKGASWAMITLEDLDGAIEVLAFPQVYASIGTLVVEDAVLAMRCKVEQREGEAVRLIALEAEAPDVGVTQSGPILVRIPVNKCVPPVIEKFQEVLSAHPGTIEVRMHVVEGAKVTVMRLDEKLRVNPTSALYSDLKALLGPNCLAGVG